MTNRERQWTGCPLAIATWIRAAMGDCLQLTRLVVLIVWGVLSLAVGRVEADWVWRVGDSQPITGRLVRQSPTEIVFAVDSSESKSSGIEITLAAAEVQRLVVTIDQDRLSKLHPAAISDYWEFADELALAPDAAARRLAVRLYVIAAAHGSVETRRRCLRGMLPLAANPEERQRWEQLLSFWGESSSPSGALMDVGQDRSESGELAQQGGDTESSKKLMALLDQLRREEFAAASAVIANQDPELRVAANRFLPQFGWESLQQWSEQRVLLTVDLYQILRWQKAIRLQQERAGDATNRPVDEWSRVAGQVWQREAKVPSLATITEFDPWESLFRDGKWVKQNF